MRNLKTLFMSLFVALILASASALALVPQSAFAGTGILGDDSLTLGYVLGGLALAVLALSATGYVAYRRSR